MRLLEANPLTLDFAATTAAIHRRLEARPGPAHSLNEADVVPAEGGAEAAVDHRHALQDDPVG